MNEFVIEIKLALYFSKTLNQDNRVGSCCYQFQLFFPLLLLYNIVPQVCNKKIVLL